MWVVLQVCYIRCMIYIGSSAGMLRWLMYVGNFAGMLHKVPDVCR